MNSEPVSTAQQDAEGGKKLYKSMKSFYLLHFTEESKTQNAEIAAFFPAFQILLALEK